MSFHDYQQPSPYGPSQPPPPNSGQATAALILGICGIFVCPLVCSILAIVFGNKAHSEIDASGGAIGGRGQATAGIVLGWVGLALFVLGLLFFGAVIVLALNDSSTDTEFQFD